MRQYHKWILRHRITEVMVTVPMFDPYAKGILYKCECGKSWAK